MSSPVYRVLDAGTTESGAVRNADMPNDVENSAPAVSVDVVVGPADNVSVPASDQVEDNAVNGDSYAARAAGSRETPRRRNVNNNDLPERPRSAFFTPSKSTSARTVFDALRLADIDAQEIACLQRKMNGEVVITFKDPATKEKFLRLNALKIGRENYAVQDIDNPLTFLTIFDAPFELSDFAIINRLSPYCEVLHHRRGRFDFASNVYNGLRHYRVRIIKPIPSFLRFGRSLIFLKHQGQVPTCRRCNLPGHFSNQCTEKICFNCENLGHESRMCPAPTLCSVCKSDDHLGKDCPYSWHVIPRWMLKLDLAISDDSDDSSDSDDDPGEPADVDADPPLSQDPPAALDSQGFLNDPDPPADLLSRPPSPEFSESASSQVTPEVVVLDSPNPPESADDDITSDPEVPPETTPADLTVASETSPVAASSTDPIPAHETSSPDPVSASGRRAPAPLSYPINFLARVQTSPVLVTSRPRSSSDATTPCADASEEDMNASSNLKRKPVPPVERKGNRKKGKK